MMSSSMLQQFLWAVFVALLLWQPCNAAQIGVGGDGTWSLQNGLSYYKAWANGVDLQVGDTIGELLSSVDDQPRSRGFFLGS